MKIESEFNPMDFFKGDTTVDGYAAFLEAFTDHPDYNLGEIFLEAVAKVLTDNFERSEDYVWDWLDDNNILERALDTECNSLTINDIVKEWQGFLDE